MTASATPENYTTLTDVTVLYVCEFGPLRRHRWFDLVQHPCETTLRTAVRANVYGLNVGNFLPQLGEQKRFNL